jgi:hypothetical protein
MNIVYGYLIFSHKKQETYILTDCITQSLLFESANVYSRILVANEEGCKFTMDGQRYSIGLAYTHHVPDNVRLIKVSDCLDQFGGTRLLTPLLYFWDRIHQCDAKISRGEPFPLISIKIKK